MGEKQIYIEIAPDPLTHMPSLGHNEFMQSCLDRFKQLKNKSEGVPQSSIKISAVIVMLWLCTEISSPAWISRHGWLITLAWLMGFNHSYMS